ncbi:serine/threonine protein kinase [Candidatus Woesearchaeota archaeon]|nr:serine/threonine protein kinase [Candidatus Woesearchaeota archaeon]MBW3005301.1 serine/threonine protein kinase [Candidatus Woesearchaeota archaeon]
MAGTDFANGKEFKARYRPIKNLGGGMSKALLAEDREYRRKVVAKFFDIDAEKEYRKKHGVKTARRFAEDLAARFALEAEVSAQLNHPHTVRVYEVGTIAGYAPFMTMEYIDGRELSKAIKFVQKARLFQNEEFLLMFYEICDTVSVAHRKRIINRDIKPENILLGKYGALKVIDWGLAKLLDGPGTKISTTDANVSLLNVNAQVNTLEGSVMGTEAYMAPEQRVGAAADERTDIYLLAGVLYNGLTGNLPERDNRNRIDTSMIAVPELRELVNKGLQTDPDNRFQTAEEFKTAIKDALAILLSERYVSEVGLLSRWIGKKKSGDVPGPLILSDIVKKWAGSSAKPSGRMTRGPRTQKLRSRKSRRRP